MSTYEEVLVSKDGAEYVSTSPAETNDLVHGRGYRLRDPDPAPSTAPAGATWVDGAKTDVDGPE